MSGRVGVRNSLAQDSKSGNPPGANLVRGGTTENHVEKTYLTQEDGI